MTDRNVLNLAQYGAIGSYVFWFVACILRLGDFFGWLVVHFCAPRKAHVKVEILQNVVFDDYSCRCLSLRPWYFAGCEVDVKAPNSPKYVYAMFPWEQPERHQITWQCVYSGWG